MYLNFLRLLSSSPRPRAARCYWRNATVRKVQGASDIPTRFPRVRVYIAVYIYVYIFLNNAHPLQSLRLVLHTLVSNRYKLIVFYMSPPVIMSNKYVPVIRCIITADKFISTNSTLLVSYRYVEQYRRLFMVVIV